MSTAMHIDARGYGKIYKAAMRNRALPLYAKAIYAYLCCYAGSGSTAYPRRDKITGDLGINKDTFTKHLHILTDGGYVARERTAAGNLYTILQTVPIYSCPPPAVEEKIGDLLVMESVQSQGYGTVPKLVMLDRRLSAQAKAIYAYFASFAGAGTTAFPRHATVLRELHLTDKTYYKHFNQLLDAGYLSVEQRKDKGKYSVNLYRLADVVHPPAPGGEGDVTGNTPFMSEILPIGKGRGRTQPSSPADTSRAGMSEKIQSGGIQPVTSEAKSDKGKSENLLSDKILHEVIGHANIRNRAIKNKCFEKEQAYNHQESEGDCQKRQSFSLPDAKQMIGYDRLLEHALSWGELKETLGQYKDSGDKARYMIRAREIVGALASQTLDRLNAAEHPEKVILSVQSDAFSSLLDQLLYRWESIADVDSYVAASLARLLAQKSQLR